MTFAFLKVMSVFELLTRLPGAWVFFWCSEMVDLRAASVLVYFLHDGFPLDLEFVGYCVLAY